MSRWSRVLSIVFSFLIAVSSLLTILMFLSELVMSGMIAFLLRIQKDPTWRPAIIVIAIALFIAGTAVMLLAIMSGRLHKARVRSSNLGTIDIGVDAIESIALNAAKTAQSGVKTVKARVAPKEGDKISVSLNLTAYSDVEIPTMMNRVQERVKKDIERYTGIEVVEVPIKVSQVDEVSSRVGR